MLIPAAQLYSIPSPFKHSNPWTTPENKVLTIKRSDFLTRPNSRGPCRVFRNMLYIQHQRSLYIPALRHKPKGVVSSSRPRIIADDHPAGMCRNSAKGANRDTRVFPDALFLRFEGLPEAQILYNAQCPGPLGDWIEFLRIDVHIFSLHAGYGCLVLELTLRGATDTPSSAPAVD